MQTKLILFALAGSSLSLLAQTKPAKAQAPTHHGEQAAVATRQDPKPTWLRGKDRQNFLKKIETAMSSIDSVAATFSQEKHLSLFDSIAKSSGAILFRRPDHLRWEIQKPFRSLLIVTGTKVAKFQFVEGKRKRLELGKSGDLILMVMDRIRDWFRGKFDESGDLYRVDLAAEPRPLIRMRPRNKSVQKSLSAIEVLLRPDLRSVVQVTIHEVGGDKTVMRFTEISKRGDPILAYFDPGTPCALDLAELALDKPKVHETSASPKNPAQAGDKPKRDKAKGDKLKNGRKR